MTHKIKPLSEELQKIAYEELGETPERISQDLQALKSWIEQQPYLRVRTNDQFLVQFLRGCKYDLEAAKKKVDYFFAFKTLFPNTIEVNSAKFREIYNLGCVAVLPTPLNGCGPRVVAYRYSYSPDQYQIEDLIEICNSVSESLVVDDPFAGVCGVIYIFDMSGVSFRHILQYTLTVVRKLVAFYDKSLPLRIRNLCYINVPIVAEQLFKMLLPCLSNELRKRVFICGKDLSQLRNIIPLKFLPEEYGGANGCLDQSVKEYNKKWPDYVEYFKQNSQYGTEENLRPGKPMDFDGLF